MIDATQTQMICTWLTATEKMFGMISGVLEETAAGEAFPTAEQAARLAKETREFESQARHFCAMMTTPTPGELM